MLHVHESKNVKCTEFNILMPLNNAPLQFLCTTVRAGKVV